MRLTAVSDWSVWCRSSRACRTTSAIVIHRHHDSPNVTDALDNTVLYPRREWRSRTCFRGHKQGDWKRAGSQPGWM